MTSCWQPGAPVQLSASTNPKRKLDWTLERIDMGAGWIGINTNRVNRYIGQFIVQQQIPELSGYTHCKAEPAYGDHSGRPSRFDFALSEPNRPTCFVEIKNATLLKDGEIQFPDAVTTRGQKHLELLADAVKEGFRAVLLFAVNRPEGQIFRLAGDIDPNYVSAFESAVASGVEVMALRIVHTKTSVEPGSLLPLGLPITV